MLKLQLNWTRFIGNKPRVAKSQTPKLVVFTALGNPPAQYSKTRHNAGHIMLESLALHLNNGNVLQKTPWTYKSLGLHYSLLESNAQTTTNADNNTQYMFVKVDGSFMNVSGQIVVPFWRSPILKQLQSKFLEIHHLVLHDELEKPLGQCQIRNFGTSARGHNGLRSIDQCNKSSGTAIEYKKIGVGIDKPTHGDIANYVLSDFVPKEIDTLENLTLLNLIKLLKKHNYM